MKKRRGCIKWAVVAVLSLVALALVVLCPLAFLYTRQVEQARAQFAPPTVVVTEPVPGLSVLAGSYVSVVATASGHAPITRVELWVDGQLAETQDSEEPEGISPYYTHFDLLVSEGPQTLFVRAINTEGIIGQSLPVGVVGEPGPHEAFLAVIVEEGETRDDIASSYGTDSGTLQELNPELGVQQPISGTLVIVPAPPEEGDEEAAPPSVGPSLPPTAPGSSPVPLPDIPPLKVIQPAPIPLGPPPSLAVFVPPQPPAVPSNLQGQVENCMVRLRWKDNAHNELRYEVWMAGLSGAPRLVVSLNPAPGGAVWVEFLAPRTGGLSFWVEAISLGGKQPSNIVWVEVDPGCPTSAPTHLEIEARDMNVPGRYDRAYCYMSFEKAPEQRLPRDDSAFIQVLGGRGDIAAWASGAKKFAVPIPGDGALDLEGECWAWSGDQLDKLGAFSDTIVSEQWNGARLLLRGDGYEIGYAVTEPGGESGLTTYEYEDPTIPPPYDIRELPLLPGKYPWLDWRDPPWRLLRWRWDGDPSKITDFDILLNGAPYGGTWHPDHREVPVPPPRQCDGRIRWEMAAANSAENVRSPLSAPLEYDLPKCKTYVRVTFKQVRLEDTSDGVYSGCTKLEVYFLLLVNDVGKNFWTSNERVSLKCGTHDFLDIIPGDDPLDLVFTVPMGTDPNKPLDVWVLTRFWDWDRWPNPDDRFGSHTHHMMWSNLKHAQDVVGCGVCGWSDRALAGTADTEIKYCIEVFPNACFDVPTKMPRF